MRKSAIIANGARMPLVPAGSFEFSSSPRDAPVVGFALDGVFYAAESAIHCYEDGNGGHSCVGGDGSTVEVDSLAEAAAISRSFTARRLARRPALAGRLANDHANAMGSMAPLRAGVRDNWIKTNEDEVTDYVTGTKSLLMVPICFNDETCAETWDNLGLIGSAHKNDPYSYFRQLVSTLNEYVDVSSNSRVEFDATYTDYVTFDQYARGQCGDFDSINYWQNGNNAYDTIAYPILNAAGAHGTVPNDWDYVVILVPYCSTLGWGGIGWVSYPGSALNVYAYGYDNALAASASAFFSMSRFVKTTSCSNLVLMVSSSSMCIESSSLFFSHQPVMSYVTSPA